MSPQLVLFWAFAVGTVGAAAMVVLAKSPITAAMSLVATFFFLAGLYVLLLAHTLAVLQVLVYAGAIMVLFLFVIMLLSLSDPEPRSKFTLSRLVGAGATLGVFWALMVAISKSRGAAALTPLPPSFGTLQHLGGVLYTQYLLPFEAVSLLLLVAIVGAVVVAKSRI